MQVACCQFEIAWEDKPTNYRRVGALVRAARRDGRLGPGALLLLPEMFATGFTMNAGAVAEDAGGPTGAFLSGLAKEHGLSVVGGAVLRGEAGEAGGAGGHPRNEALAYGPDGRLVGRFPKVHGFRFAGEHEHYAPAELGVGKAGAEVAGRWLFPVGDWRVMPAVCYDLRFPELFRAPAGAPHLIAVIANWPAKRADHWLALLKARAIENQCYVAAVNRVGNDPPGNDYSGRSQIIDPRGRLLVDAGGAQGVIAFELSRRDLDEYRRAFPALEDRRAELRPEG